MPGQLDRMQTIWSCACNQDTTLIRWGLFVLQVLESRAIYLWSLDWISLNEKEEQRKTNNRMKDSLMCMDTVLWSKDKHSAHLAEDKWHYVSKIAKSMLIYFAALLTNTEQLWDMSFNECSQTSSCSSVHLTWISNYSKFMISDLRLHLIKLWCFLRDG